MPRRVSAVVGALVLALIVVVWFVTGPNRRSRHGEGADSPLSVMSTKSLSADAGQGAVDEGGSLGKADDARHAITSGEATELLLSAFPAGFRLLDGGAVPRLDENAPSRVRFGVVQVMYRGAQGARGVERTKRQALERAKELLEIAREDFGMAVKQGDDGSVESLGWISRGILEPAPEYVVFSTKAGDVGGPVDTPRGFWIIKILGVKR